MLIYTNDVYSESAEAETNGKITQKVMNKFIILLSYTQI